jgi:hypothetical protein
MRHVGEPETAVPVGFDRRGPRKVQTFLRAARNRFPKFVVHLSTACQKMALPSSRNAGSASKARLPRLRRAMAPMKNPRSSSFLVIPDNALGALIRI